MAVIKYRDFTIHTGRDCGAKNKRSFPVQVRDPSGFHYMYMPNPTAARRCIDNWWIWSTANG